MPARRHAVALLTGLTLLALSAIASPAPARAQEPVIIDALTISIWPEFDQPAALLIYSGTVADDTPLPATLTFTLPDTVSLHAVAYASEGQLANMDHEVEGNRLVVTTPNGTFHIEVYDAALAVDGQDRSYSLTWTSEHPVRSLVWQAQQPAGARSLTVTPGISTASTDSYGLQVLSNTAGEVPAGTPSTVTINYYKSRGGLTTDLLERGPGILGAGETPLPNSLFLAGMGFIIAALAATAGYFYAVSRRTRALLAQARSDQAGPPVARPLDGRPPDARRSEAEALRSQPPGISRDRAAVMQATSAGLTEREAEVLALVAEGLSNPEIGARLDISPKTVSRHRENIMRKLNLHTRTELVKYALRIGLIHLKDEE
jgi:DNA-binding CsgD family transcriptional regulator